MLHTTICSKCTKTIKNPLHRALEIYLCDSENKIDKYISTTGLWKLKEKIVFVFITASDKIELASISVRLSFFLIGERTEFFTMTKAAIINGINPKEIKVNL